MSALSEFTNFQDFTPPVYIKSPSDMQNDAIVQAPLMGRLLLNRSMSEVLQSGRDIRETPLLSVTSTFQNYTPGDSVGGYQNPQDGSVSIAQWRFSRDHMSWTEAELTLNVPEGTTRRKRASLYKDLAFRKEQRLWTSVFNGMEDRLLADPAGREADIETASGEFQHPLYALINEETNRLPDGWSGNAVQNISRTVPAVANSQQGWQNRRQLYDHAQPDDEDNDGDGLLDRFEDMRLQLDFRPPSMAGTQQYFQKSSMDPVKMFVAASGPGIKFYNRRLMERNDTLASREDPAYVNSKYAGVELFHVAGLGSAVLYQTSTAARAAEEGSSVTNTGPRYFFINGNFLRPVFHVSKFFDKQKSFSLAAAGQPDTQVQIIDIWWNLLLLSSLRQGIVSPGG